MSLPEIVAATGSQASLAMNLETTWGVLRTSGAAWKYLRVIGGEGMDQNLAIYQSQEIRSDRFENQDVRGTEDPGGTIPFELSPKGWIQFLYHLLGGSLTTNPDASRSCVQTVTITGTPTGGSFRLTFRGKTTADIAHNALASVVQSSLEAISTIGSGGVTVTGTSPTYTVTFAGTLADSNVELFECDGSTLTGGTDPAVFAKYDARGFSSSNDLHVLTGGNTSFPAGFTLEKTFGGLPSTSKDNFQWKGCRIDSMDLDMGINQIPSGSFDVVARIFDSTTAAVASSVTAAPTEDPFTSSQIVVMEGTGTSHGAIGIATSASLRITNNYNRDGYVLGSKYRAALRPGRFMVSGSMNLMFKNSTMFEKAINGTDSQIWFSFHSGEHSIDFILPSVDFTPNGSVPKISTDGPIEIPVNFKALKSSTFSMKSTAASSASVAYDGTSAAATSLIVQMVVPEAAAAITG